MTTKLITTFAATLLAATFSITTLAEAGCGGHGGFARKSTNYSQAAYAKKQKAKARAQALAAAKRRKAIAAKKAEAAKVAEAGAEEGAFVEATSTAAVLTKNDIATATAEAPGQVGEAQPAKDASEEDNPQVAAVADQGSCKRFVPAAGMTISIACE